MATHEHKLPYIPKILQMNYGTGLMYQGICRECGKEAIFQVQPVNGEALIRRNRPKLHQDSKFPVLTST